jgi:prepilin-type N-terminal cleavage/methylation domain-containing protein
MKKTQAFTLVELMVVVGIIGILASLAIPNFMVFLARAKQAEVKSNLGSIYNCQLSYFAAANTFAGVDTPQGNAFVLVNFTPIAGHNRYAYILDQSAIIPSWFEPGAVLPPGINSSNTGFTVIGAGNVDGDPFLDTWYVNNAKVFQNKDPNTGADGNDLSN